ncbi:MAG TPA: hypothetical protein VGW32_10940 [Pyrinomonadaceae bacterium]|nr:hypothetical protein [Pyrinomonadaceae bacterium]
MKKFLSLLLSMLLLHVFSPASLANENPLERAKKVRLESEVKAGIAYLGVGKSSVVRVVLYDKTKYHGYITEITDESFVVADAKTGATAPIAYSEVKGIKGNNFSTGAKIGIGVAIAAAVIIIIAVLASKDEGQSPNGQIICVTSPCP